MELKQKWVDALRSGKYQQGKSALRVDDKFCCLGVLCDVYDPSGWGPEFTYGRSCHVLDPNLREKIGLSYENMNRLWRMNDSNHDFAEIADVIEKEVT